MINIKPLYAVAVIYDGEEEAAVLKQTISHKRDHVAVMYDTTRFSSPPDDCVFLINLAIGEVIDSNQGEGGDMLLKKEKWDDYFRTVK